MWVAKDGLAWVSWFCWDWAQVFAACEALHVVKRGPLDVADVAEPQGLLLFFLFVFECIDGVYAMAPMLFGFYGRPPPELMSWRENLDLMGSYAAVRAFRMAYDPSALHERNPLAYPFSAKTEDLRGLPPHILHNHHNHQT